MVPPATVERVELPGGVVVGVAGGVPVVDAEEYDVLLTGAADPPRPWVRADLDEVERGVHAAPDAATVLTQVLRATEGVPVPAAVVVESLAYSVLQHGERFESWLATRPAPGARPDEGDPVRLAREGDHLAVTLCRPGVHNALNAAMRDALCEAFELVAADPAVRRVDLRGDGPSFCSGGDLAEFGTTRDAARAHAIRVARCVGERVHRAADRVTAWLHGSCIGAGIEIPAFAGRVVARPDVQIRLPELAMGLIPGAGGTVSLPRRIGRHRTAYLVLTGRALDGRAAHAWGLVDELADW